MPTIADIVGDPSLKRPALEAVNEGIRKGTPICSPYVNFTPSAFTSTTRTFDELKAVLRSESLDYVHDRDVLNSSKGQEYVPTPNHTGIFSGVVAATPSPFQNAVSGVLRCLGAESQVTLSDIFDPKGSDAAHITSKSALRAYTAERSLWSDLLIRTYTLHHNGVQTAQPLVDELPSYLVMGTDSKTRFHKAARTYKLPTQAYIESIMPAPGKGETAHAYLAAARHATVASLRALAMQVGAMQVDPCISSSARDKGAFGERPVHTVKDLAHTAKPPPAEIDPGVKEVRTLIDCLTYENSLAEHSGYDMIIWTSYYPDLAGETVESTYYADSDKTFVEVIGKDKADAIWKKQYAWDFTSSDVVYIENEDHSAFTIYSVVRYPQPELLKQVVFLCALQTVNMPYAIANQLVRWTKKHDLGSVGIGTPKLCSNVVLVPKDPARPFTQDILVMANGTPGCPTVSIKYKNATSPRSVAVMPTQVYDYLKYLNSHGGRGLTVNEVIKRLEFFSTTEYNQFSKLGGDGDVCVPGSAAYCELLRTVAWWGDLPNVIYYGTKVSPLDEPVEAESAKAVMAAPKITGNNPGVLAKTPEAMDAYVKEKLVGMKNTTTPTDEWTKISDVILGYWIKGVAEETGISKGTVQLVDTEVVLENRTKKIQRARQVTAGLGPGSDEIGRVEMKVEVGHKTKTSARGIQNPAPDISVLSGVLGKSLEIVLKKTSWYNPGSTPKEISDSVTDAYLKSHSHELNYQGGGVRSVDYEGADERHCKHSSRILRKFIDYFFTDGDKAEAQRIYDKCFNMPLQVGPKVMSSGDKNCSGTGITTVLNTSVFSERELETTVIAMVFRSMEDSGELKKGEYIKSDTGDDRPFPELTHKVFLKHLRNIQGTWDLHKIGEVFGSKHPYTIERAYRWIGPKFGDDGLDPATPYVDNGTWERAMLYVDRQDGFVRKLETTSAVKEEPVEYLSRIYPCPMRSPSSYCKVEKAVDKISIAVNRDRARFILKLCGYHTTDRNTPIVGALLTAVGKMYGIELTLIEDDATMLELYETDRELYWKVTAGPFPWDENASDEQYESVAAEYGMTSGELREFDERLRSQSTWSGIQQCMLPTKISVSSTDPLGLQTSIDPPGISRVPAFSTSSRGEDPRMCNFESSDAIVATPSNAARDEAAKRALQL